MTHRDKKTDAATPPIDPEHLRRRAEEAIKSKQPDELENLSPEATRQILHELRVHQLELEMQNEELRRVNMELDAARAKYLDLYDLAPVGYIALSQNGLILESNLTAAALLGWSQNELVKKSISKFIFKADQDSYYLHSKQILTAENPHSYELRMLKKDGSTFWARLQATASLGHSRRLVGGNENALWIHILISDITKQKLTEKALLKSQNRLQDAYKMGHIGAWDWDADTDTVIWTEELYRIAGLDPMLPAPTYAEQHNIFVRESWELLKPAVERAMETGETYNLELILIRPDGSTRHVNAYGSIKSDSDGRVTGLYGIMQDITKRKHAEETLEQTRQNYETFFDTIDEFLLVADEHGKIIHTNKSVITRLGYAREELIGKPVIMIHPPECIDEAGRIVGEMLNRKTDGCTLPIVTKTGVRIPVETKVTHGIWDGKPAIFGVSKDMSKIKESEEKFSKVFHLNPSACGLSDLADQKYIELNRAFYTLFGFDKDEAIGKTAEELGILTAKEKDAILAKADSKGTVINAYADLKKKNGDIIHVLLSAENISVQDKKYRFTVVHDITDIRRLEVELEKYRRHLEHMIEERTSELEVKSMTLQETNMALKVLLRQREDDKKDMEERFLMNIQTLVLTHVDQMKKGSLESRQRSYLGIIEAHLKEIASPLLKNMQQFNFTPRETRVVSLIKLDKSTKEIAEVLSTAIGSIDVHRRNIRKKLGLTNRRTNLVSYLKNLENR
jgi:PAS domain S-box-containing protein